MGCECCCALFNTCLYPLGKMSRAEPVSIDSELVASVGLLALTGSGGDLIVMLSSLCALLLLLCCELEEKGELSVPLLLFSYSRFSCF